MKKQFTIFLLLTMLFSLPNNVWASNLEIKSFSPSSGAIGDTIELVLPHSKVPFPDCWIPGETSYGSTSGCHFSAKVYFNNVEVTPDPTYIGMDSLFVKVPTNAINGKIRVELTADYAYHNKNYAATFLSATDFTILSPSAQDDLSVRQQYLQQTKVDQAWNYSHGSSEVVIAVIDDGVYTGHPDLDSNIWINNGDIEGNGKDDDHNGYIDDRWGWNFIANSKDMTTLGTHGTMVAGIIGAESNNNTGISGINWNVKLMPVIACNNSGCGDQAITSAVKYAVDNGADIINLSLAGSVFNYTDDFNTAIKYAFDRNVLVVVAAGNGDVEGGIGRNLNTTKVSPVCNDGNENMVLGVGAINANNQITSWSNYGNCVDVYAPGENIVSTAVPAHSTLSGFYDTADGTSFSTPIVSGIAALIKAKYPEIKNTAIRDRIINNSDNQNNINIVNAHKAISQAFTDNEKKTGSAINPTPIATDPATGDAKNLQNKLKGYILLQVESHGEAWYVNPVDGKRYYMKDGATAYEMMRKFGLGITNTDLGKLPQENQRNNNPSLVNKLKGKILLQVQSLGEAWYINPKTGFRYYMKNGEAAYNLMRNYSLGITNKDLEKIPIGNF